MVLLNPEANKHMHLDKKQLHKFLRSYYHMKSADWKENNPYELVLGLLKT